MRSGFLGVAGATAAAAVLTYLLTGTVARAASAADNAAFVTFWFGALIVGLGVFLPLEQVLSRAATAGTVRRAGAVRAAFVLLVVAVIGVLAVSPVLGTDAATRAWVAAALVAVALVGALQYAVRGVALGRGRLGAYAAALLADAGLRAVGAVLVALLVTRPPGALFAACVVGSALVAHVGLLLALRRQAPAAERRDGLHDYGELGVAAEPAGDGTAAPAAATGAVLALLGASVVAQVLLNAGPVVLPLGGGPDEVIAAYGYAFNLARAPLFVVVPVQAVLVPPLVRMVVEGRLHELRVRMAQVAVVVAVLAAVGAGVGALLAGPVMRVYTGTLQVPSGLMALLVGGCIVHAGLVVGTQALIATGRERWVLACWVTGLVVAVAGVALLQLGAGAQWAVAGGFTAGSAVAWLLSVLVLVQRPRAGAAGPAAQVSR